MILQAFYLIFCAIFLMIAVLKEILIDINFF